MAVPLCDYVLVLNNTSSEVPFERGVTCNNGISDRHVAPLPDWAAPLI